MIRTIAAKELRILFSSPLAWVVLAFLQLICAWIFLSRLQDYLNVQMQIAANPAAPGITEWVITPVFGTAAIFMLMVVPLLSMRMIAEERRNQTLVFLISAPVSITQIVVAKLLALLAFLAIPVGLIALMGVALMIGGKIDFGMLAANTLGLLLLCATFAAIGLYLSSVTAQPIVAAVGTYAVLLLLWLINIGTSDPDSAMHMLSLVRHFESFAKGVLSLADAAYYVVLALLFTGLAVRRLEGDRVRA
ncbi:MAG: ABC transporter permease [Burkholderiales bacterium]